MGNSGVWEHHGYVGKISHWKTGHDPWDLHGICLGYPIARQTHVKVLNTFTIESATMRKVSTTFELLWMDSSPFLVGYVLNYCR